MKNHYLRLLEPWVKSARKDFYSPPDRPDLLCYGSGYNGWGVQTNQKALAAFAILGTDPELDCDRTGMEGEEITERALQLLRFSLASHLAGDYQCLDGESWGHTWISALGIERMMHAVDELWQHMTPLDHQNLRRVLVSECDWLVDYYHRGDNPPGTVTAGPVENNHPENNLWNGILLHRVAMIYPDLPRIDEYLRQGTKFVLNGISVESDADDDRTFAGVPLAEWHVGGNFFPSYGLNHHRYLNVGYMVICLSQVAMGHFAWKRRGLEAPPSFYLHLRELWEVVKKMTFPDGRLARIGGDTRARYCYCQDYAIPTWLLMLDRFGDTDCIEFEKRWLEILRREVAAADQPGFLQARLGAMAELSPTYYTRLESDRAAALSMAICWRRHFADFKRVTVNPRPAPVLGAWSDQYHGATMVRGERRLASWTWRAAAPPQGLCVPVKSSDMAEWRSNMAATITGVGARNLAEVRTFAHSLFDQGFVNFGICDMRSERNLAEGTSDKVVARQHIAFAALPDDATVVGIQFATAVNRPFIRSTKTLNLMMPNDIFNHRVRRYFSASGELSLVGPSTASEVIDLKSQWLNVDDRLTVLDLDGKGLKIFRPGARQIEILNKPFTVSSLHADEICVDCDLSLRSYDPGQLVVDTAFAVRVGEDHETARSWADQPEAGQVFRGTGFRAATCRGADKRLYLLLFNLTEVELTVPLRLAGYHGVDLVTRETVIAVDGSLKLGLKAGQARIIGLEATPCS